MRLNVSYILSLLLIIFTFGSIKGQEVDSIPTTPVQDSVQLVSDSATINKSDSTVSSNLPQENNNEIESSSVEVDSTRIKAENEAKENKKLFAYFVNKSIIFDKGKLVSNVIQIINYTENEVSLSYKLTIPKGWKKVAGSLYNISVKPGDSVFLPVRVLPSPQLLGNTQYYIECLLYDEEEGLIGLDNFYCFSKRYKDWTISSNQGNVFYFKNNESDIDFDINVFNKGNEKQALLLQTTQLNSGISVQDTNGNSTLNQPMEFSLDALKDTNFYFTVEKAEEQRNFKLVDEQNYVPNSDRKVNKFSYFITTKELVKNTTAPMKKSQKIDFIDLPNITEANPYGGNYLPLTVDFTTSNLFGNVFYSNLSFRGLKNFEDATLIYNGNINFSSNEIYYSNSSYRFRMPFYIGYFAENFDAQLGDLNSNTIGYNISGKGVKGSYTINEQNKVGGFALVGPTLYFPPVKIGSGVFHEYKTNKLRNKTTISFIQNRQTGIRTQLFTVQPTYRINNTNMISLNASYSLNRAYLPIAQNNSVEDGYLLGFGYNSSLFDRVWSLNVRANYQIGNNGSYSFNRINGVHSSKVKLGKDYNINVINNFNLYEYISISNGLTNRNTLNINNNVTLNSSTKLKNFSPGFFYNINQFDTVTFHNRGLNFTISKYDLSKNLQASFNSRFGLGRWIEYSKKEYFNILSSLFVRYKVLSVNMFYRIGPNSASSILLTENLQKIPQDFRASFNHQYLFKNKSFILRNTLSYFYSNINNRHTFSYGPTLNYYTVSGWRFQLRAIYNFNTSKLDAANYNDLPGYLGDDEFDRSFNDAVNFTIGIRKNLGIPIPGKKNQFKTVSFRAFYDINGNGKFDPDEQTIPNVVVSLGKTQVLTNQFGIGVIENVSPELQKLNAMSLDNLNEWFPFVDDSLAILKGGEYLIPFVKGVKVFGQITLEREGILKAGEEKVELYGIRVTADSKTYSEGTLTDKDGYFEMYLPFGQYTISLDESVLGSRFSMIKNNYNVKLESTMDNIYLSFIIKEKKRKLKVKKFGKAKDPEEKD